MTTGIIQTLPLLTAKLIIQIETYPMYSISYTELGTLKKTAQVDLNMSGTFKTINYET